MSLALNGTNGVTYNDGTLQSSAPVGRNLIINGNMRIAQRGTSVTGITSGGHYTTDRFQMYNQNSATYTLEQSTDSPANFTNSTKVTVTTAGSSATASWTSFLQTKLEGQDIALLNAGTSDARTATLSFWVKSSLTGDMPIQLKNNADRQYLTSYTISTANTWEHKTITVTFPTDGTWTTDNSRGLQLTWGLGAGSTYTNGTVDSWQSGLAYYFVTGNTAVGETSGATWQITGIQLEVGTTATDFEHLPYGQQLALCQRYCYVQRNTGSQYVRLPIGYNLTTTASLVIIPYPVTMRAEASFSWIGSFQSTAGGGATGTVAAIISDAGTLNFGSLSFTFSSGTVTVLSLSAVRTTSTDWQTTFTAEL